MTEHPIKFDLGNTEPIPKGAIPAVHRASFVPLSSLPLGPPEYSQEAADYMRRHSRINNESVFDPINPLDPDSPLVFQSLTIGETVKVPVPVYQDDEQVPGVYTHEVQRVVGTLPTTKGYVAEVRTEADMEDFRPADPFAGKYSDNPLLSEEARAAWELLARDGIDIHSPSTIHVDGEQQND